MSNLQCVTLASGSSGNSTYISNKNTKILIDCGISASKVQKVLTSICVEPQSIDAIFITHEHIDHIEGAGVLSRRFNIPIYATEKTWLAMQQKIGAIYHDNKVIIYPNEKVIINDLYIVPFSVCHDAKDPVCYNIYYNNSDKILKKISILTDLGYIDDNILKKIKGCSLLLIESNYNRDMLLNGSYPNYLKQRVLGKFGHISNETCAKVICATFSKDLKNVILLHISKENNTKDLAISTITDILHKFGINIGIDLNLYIAPSYGAGIIK